MPKKNHTVTKVRSNKKTLDQLEEWAKYWSNFTPPDITPIETGWMQAAIEVQRILNGGNTKR